MLLVACMPFLVRATTSLPDGLLPQAATPTAQVEAAQPIEGYATLPARTLAPDETATLPPAATMLPLAATDVQEEVLFVDSSAASAGEASEAASGGDAGTEQPDAGTDTGAQGAWTYENSAIAVNIAQHEQGKFVYFVADIQLTDPGQFSYAFSHEKYGARTEALSDMAERHDPVVAINGDYYSFHNNGIIIRGGEAFRRENSKRHLLIVEENGDLTVMTDRSEKQGVVANRLLERNVLHTFEFGPVLVENGEAVHLDSAILRVGEGYLEPRTAIGQLGPLHYLIIVVDGRSDGYSEGCDLPTLQQLFVDRGVTTAFNLDGGGSTTLWFNGEIINKPASGDERKVSDIVMFMAE